MTYDEIVERICGSRRFGKSTGVEVSGRMLSLLGNPQQGMKWIHIAGTNGKGSVSAFLCEILRAAGLRTGMFTSPHLVDFRERIRVDGEMIEREAVERIGAELLARGFGVEPTMFDYCLAMALLYLKERACDVAVIETGLGGRLDSTNAVGTPEVCVLTRIGYDHMAILGNTTEEIAREKAGILKPGVSVVAEPQERAVRAVFREAAARVGVRAYREVDGEALRGCRYADGEQRFSYGGYEDLRMRMLGLHQYENAAAAILAAEEYFLRACPQMDGERRGACIRAGIAAARWDGRMQIVRKDPFLLVDGAHNGNGVEALGNSLRALFPGEKFHFVMGVMADKDYVQMVELLLPLALDFCTVTVESARALAARELAAVIRQRGVPARCAGSLQDCLAPENCDRRHRTVAFGSLYFVGEILRWTEKRYGFVTKYGNCITNDTFS